MYRSIKDFTTDWQHESEMTLKMFTNITNESLDQKVYTEGRTMQRLIWHITVTLPEMLGKAGVHVKAEEDAPAPATAKEIYTIYKTSAESLAKEVAQNWSDSDLETEIPMYGDSWTKGVILSILIKHQAHHRGQLTVLMRQAGLKVPGAYGPSKEEWIAWGQQPME